MRIVHYINQFFGQIGAESEAYHPLEVREGVVGPGMALKAALGSDAEIIATIICGDNYFVENTESLTDEIVDILKKYEADMLVAGPAFNAGRYGMACGGVCKIANEVLGIHTVSAMYKENPGLEIYKNHAYIFPTVDSARGMRDAIKTVSAFIKKIANNETIGGPEEEGYFTRGIRKNIFCKDTGAKRAVDMALAKINGTPFKTELKMPEFKKFKPSPAIKDIKNAIIAVMTSGGIVPTGNPDRLEAAYCTKYKAYTFEDFGGEGMPECEVAHGGYDPIYANEDGNRVLPIESMLDLEKDGETNLYRKFYVTVGNSMGTDRAGEFGDAIAKELLDDGKVDGVILTST